jgi:uncharacterized protein (TIGR04255 family)
MGEMTMSLFGAEPVAEIPLARAPLVNVLAQVRYPKIPLLGTEDGAASLRDRLRERYPILRQESALALVVSSSGVAQELSHSPLWRLQDRDGTWKVTVSDDFVAVENRAYVSRQDFCTRLDEVLAAVSVVGEPVIYDRVGVRYTNQLIGEAAERVLEFIRPELHGILSVPLENRVELTLALSEALFRITNEDQLRARWGSLPANAQVDPTIPSVPSRSWILDLDSFTEASGDFDTAALGELTRRLADQAYRFFRWVVTPAFDTFFSGAA